MSRNILTTTAFALVVWLCASVMHRLGVWLIREFYWREDFRKKVGDAVTIVIGVAMFYVMGRGLFFFTNSMAVGMSIVGALAGLWGLIQGSFYRQRYQRALAVLQGDPTEYFDTPSSLERPEQVVHDLTFKGVIVYYAVRAAGREC